MDPTDHENTEDAKNKRKARWQKRGLHTARILSRRYERAAAILLRTMLVYHKHRNAPVRKAVEFACVHNACIELYGERPVPIRGSSPRAGWRTLKTWWKGNRRQPLFRGIHLATEAIAILGTIFPPLEGQDYPSFPMEAVKMAYWQCRNAAATARQREAEMGYSAEAAMATRKFFDVIAKICPSRVEIFRQAAAECQPPIVKLKGAGYGEALGRIKRAALPRFYTTHPPK